MAPTMRLSLRLAAAAAAATVLGLASPASAQQATGNGVTGDSFCSGNDFCVTAVYNPQTRASNYTLVVQKGGAPFGWAGVGIGNQMAGANIVVAWLNADGTQTISQRGARGEVEPEEDEVTAAAFTRQLDTSSTSAERTIFSWSMPQSQAPGAGQQHIWALSSRAPSSSASTAEITKHSTRGFFSLDMSEAYDGSAPAGLPVSNAAAPTTTTSGAGEGVGDAQDINTKYNRLIVVHLVFMIAAWMLLVPAAVLTARYGRTLFKWFPAHRGLQLTAVAFIIIGFGVVVAAVNMQGSGAHFSNHHEQLGLFLFLAVLVQAAWGQVQHVIVHKTGNRIGGYIHALFGVSLFIIATYNIGQGFAFWDYETPSWRAIPVYAWAGFMGLLYIVGFALIPRELKHSKRAIGDGTEKSIDSA